MTVSLDDLPFIDLYVRLDKPDQAYYRSRERGKGTISQFVPQEYSEQIDRFMIAVNGEMREGASDGSIDFEGLRCRLSRQTMSDHTTWVCARRINTIIPDIAKLGYPTHIYESIHSLGKRDGLILVSGATGHGKTTTAVAMLADFLRSYGGTAVTIEDPVRCAPRKNGPSALNAPCAGHRVTFTLAKSVRPKLPSRYCARRPRATLSSPRCMLARRKKR
jgi:hypothetical protein